MLIACTNVHAYIFVYLVTYKSVHARAGLYMQILIVRTDGPDLSMCVSIFPATFSYNFSICLSMISHYIWI